MLSRILVVALFAMLLLVGVEAAKGPNMDKYNKRTGAKYIEEMSKKEGSVLTKSGMVIEMLEEKGPKPSRKGEALSPTKSDNCEVTYA